jgi:hypothetical protein
VKDFFEKNPRLKPVAITGIFYLLIAGFIFVTLSGDSQVKVLDKEARVADDDAEIHPARTYLRIDNGDEIVAYYARLDTTNGLMSLFDYHRENSGFTYSQTGYTYGLGFDNINGQKAPEGYIWRLYDNDEEITYDVKDIKLENNHTYLLKIGLEE